MDASYPRTCTVSAVKSTMRRRHPHCRWLRVQVPASALSEVSPTEYHLFQWKHKWPKNRPPYNAQGLADFEPVTKANGLTIN